MSRGKALQQRLRSLEVFESLPGDETRIIVPPEAQRALKDFKDALLDSADRALPKVLQERDLSEALRGALAAEGYDWAASEHWVDGVVDGSIVPVPDHHERWAMDLCVLLAPGSDCMLALYERRGGQLRRALVVRSDLYSSIEGALHGLTWAVSPPDDDDSFYLLEAHTFPWPSSRWRAFTYRALVPGAKADEPRVLAHATDFGNWQGGYELDAKPDRFTVKFDVMSEQAPDFTAPKVHTWQRQGDQFRVLTKGVRSK